jgi:hypothetical protein
MVDFEMPLFTSSLPSRWLASAFITAAHLSRPRAGFLGAVAPIAGTSQPVVRAGHVPALPAHTLRLLALITYDDWPPWAAEYRPPPKKLDHKL